MNRKYELTDETKMFRGHLLHRIRARRDFGKIKAGDLGGWIQSERNLSAKGTAWVYDEACVYDSAVVREDARVTGEAWVLGHAMVAGHARVMGHAFVGGDSLVCGSALVTGHSVVERKAQVFGNAYVGQDAYISGKARICGSAVVTGLGTLVTGTVFIGDDAHVEGANVRGDVCLCGVPVIDGLDIDIGKNEHYLVIGGIARPQMRLTFARTRNSRIRLISGIYTGDIEDYEFSDEDLLSPEASPVDKYYKEAIELAKLYITDTIYST